jgi:hypothetical protein
MKLKNLISEKNVPTNPTLWAKFVAQAKKKFDVYPSAYANGWASKQYKDAGGKWKTEEAEEPRHVAVALPQTKELKGKKLGERFLEYLQDNGLKHAAYQNEAGNVKIVGLNKEQVKEAIKNVVENYTKKNTSIKPEGFPGGAGVGVALPGGYINGAPSEKDVEKMKKNLK